MQVAPTEQIAHFDVDDTLIVWDDQFAIPSDERVRVVCPYDGAVSYHNKHSRHIGFLKKLKARGYTIVVWSAAGTKWAESVVKSLELEDYVDWVQAKPQKIVDDLPSLTEIMPNPIYLTNKKGSI